MKPDLAAGLGAADVVIKTADDDDLPAVLGELERMRASVLLRLTAPRTNGPSEDRLLTLDQAAERLASTPDWLRRHAINLPFTVRLSQGQLRFSAKALDRWIASQAGKGGAP